MLLPLRQLQAVEIGERDAQILSLAARVWSHRHVAIRATGEPWVDRQTEAGVSSKAVFAEAAGDVEGHDHAVTLLDGYDAWPDILHNAHVFVAEDDPRLGGGAPFVHMQVGPADGRGRNTDQRIIGVLN